MLFMFGPGVAGLYQTGVSVPVPPENVAEAEPSD